MRTTLDLDDHLLREAKKLAAERGQTLTSFVEDALRDAVQGTGDAEPFRLRWKTVRGTGRPRVDPADRDALYDLMEGRD